MEKSLLIKRLVECKAVNNKLTEAYNLSMQKDLEASELFTKCTALIKELSDLSLDFEYLRENAPKYDLKRNEFSSLLDAICEYLGDAVEYSVYQGPVFAKASHLEGCPISTDDLVMYTAKPVDVMVRPIVEFDKEKYKICKCYHESTGYYDIYLTTLEK